MGFKEDTFNEELFHKFIAPNIPNFAIFILDKEEQFIFVEGNLLGKLGYAKADLLNKNASLVIPSHRYDILGPLFKRLLKGERFSIQRHINGNDVFIQFIPLTNICKQDGLGMILYMDISEIVKSKRGIYELNKNLEQKVIEGSEQLNEINKEFDAFSYSISHDLRAPLRAIEGYSKMIQEDYGAVLDTEGQRFLDIIQANVKYMNVQIENLLNYSRIGRKELIKIEVDMLSNVKAALTEVDKSIVHHAEIVIEDLFPVYADYTLINRVFVNLISNAIKFSSKKEKPVIHIKSAKEENEIIYSIHDNGVGFEMKYAGKLFNIFQRLHSMDEFEGVGGGLAIVYRIIKKHGGRVWAEGKPDTGATFYFSLPLNCE